MSPQQDPIPSRQNRLFFRLAAGLALLADLLFSTITASAQPTLMFRMPFDAAHSSATGTSNDATGLLPAGSIVLNTLLSPGTTIANTTPADLRGGPNSGVQGVGESINFTNSSGANNSPAVGAYLTNSAGLAVMGDGVTPGSTFSSFTATIWINQSAFPTAATDTEGPVYFLLGHLTTLASFSAGAANTITFRGNHRSGAGVTGNLLPVNGITNTFEVRLNGFGTPIEVPLYYPLPNNVWQFFAIVYNATNQNCYVYWGTDVTPAKLMQVKNFGAQTFTFGAANGLVVGNDYNNFQRHFDGREADLQFYTGAPGGDVANQAFVEAIRQQRTPVVISGLYPNGSSLMQGTNTLAFTASSASGINPANIHATVNGTDVSGSLVIGGASTARTVSYTGLPVNQPLAGLPGFYANINMATIALSVTDSNGITATNLIIYDDYSPTNFTWEAEDYDFNSGQFIDNPAYSFVSAANAYFGQTGASTVDYNYLNPAASVFRPSDSVRTEYSVANDNGQQNQNNSNMGELMRDKILAALDLNLDGNEGVREVDVNSFAAGDSMNYTRTYPSGYFNVYLRVAAQGAMTNTLSTVTSGWGTASQTTSVLGTFSVNSLGTGGSENYAWIPLQNNGTNAIIPLGGTNTLNLAAGANGTFVDVNFLMLVQQPVPGFLLQPVNQTTTAGFPATFNSQVFATNTITYQWQRSNPGITSFGPVSGATNASYTTPLLSIVADNQAQYRVLATSGGITITSAVAVVTVTPSIPPVLLGALNDFQGITVAFSEAVDPVSGANPVHYALSGGASVTGAGVSGSNVVLSASGLTLGQNYTLTVNNVSNLFAGVVAANSTAGFGAYTFVDNFNGGAFPAVPAYATLFNNAVVVPTGGSNGTGGLLLVPGSQQKFGSILFPDALNGGSLTSFEAAFDLQFANPAVPPADGFSFNLGGDVTSTFGVGGSGTGLSVVIVLSGATVHGVAGPCISVIYQGAIAQSAIDATFLTQPIDPATLIDGKFDQVIIKVAADGTLNLAINGVSYFGGQAIAGWAPLTAPLLGIGGSTPQGGWVQMSIDDLQVVYNGTLPLPLPPTVRITSPFNGITAAAGTDVPFTVDAADPQGSITKVEYFVNGTKVFTNTVAPYSFTLTNVGNSVYNVFAKVTDALNLTGNSQTVQVIGGNPSQMLYVTAFGTVNASDTAFISHLSNLGFNVVQEYDLYATAGDAAGKVLVVISSTVASANMDPAFSGVAVPMLLWEQGLEGVELFTLDDAADHNVDASTQSQIKIINPASPLAAGLSGTVTVQTSATSMPWGIPSTNAILVALVPGSTNEYCLYAYEKGALLIDGVTPAPARRVQTFLFDNDYVTLTAAGQQLVNASIAWLLATPQPVISVGTLNGNSLTLTWSQGGTLQAAPTPAGPWLDVSTTNTFTTTITNNTARFFRVKM